MDNILVSVICMAYNQEAYIRDALDGFVCQRTNFAFEVLVHDDASTDGTAGIIREYAERYPDLIRPVFQKENQYSKGIPISSTFLYPLIRGRYVAFCEGDDYWSDPLKLQRQVDAMEAHPELDSCACRALRLNGAEAAGFIAPKLKDSVLTAGEVILGGGNYVATASLLCRKEAYMEHTPMRDVMVNDNVLQIQCSLRGGMLYLHECMAVYRVNVPGSWSSRHPSLDEDHDKLFRMLDTLDDYTEGKYHSQINLRKRLYLSNGLIRSHRQYKMLYPKELWVSLHRLCRHVSNKYRAWKLRT